MSGQSNGSNGTLSPVRLYDIRSVSYPGPTPQATDYEKFRGVDTAIVIDNGSCQLRAGWATESSPRLAIENLVARYKERKAPKTYCLVGNDVLADQTARIASKSPFEGPVVSNWDLMETVLDYTFVKLGIQDDSVAHPIVMTEPVCNPNYNRKTMSELLFETYSAPSISYGIDALFSYKQNSNTPKSTGLVISSGNHATHVIPVIQGRGVLSQAKRLQWGGTQAVEFMLKLLQLKYPSFPSKLTLLQAQTLTWDHCYVAQDYVAELSCMLDKTHLKEADRTIQFPYTEFLANAKSEEELARALERKKESGRRLQEQAAKMRAEKLAQNENDLEYYRNVQSFAETDGKREFQRRVEGEGFGDVSELEKEIKRLEAAIKRSKQRDMASSTSQVDEEDLAPPTYPLLDVPDDQLDAEGLKQKRQQRLNKAGYDARMRMKAEKEAVRRREEEIQLADDEQRINNFDAWLEGKRQSRNELMERLKVQRRLKAELNDRKSLASQMRMKSIANLASDAPNGKKRRKNDDDMFGANDADWNIYKDIGTSKEGAEVESEDDEERTIEALRRLEGILLIHDAAFDETQLVDAEQDPSKSLIHAFLRGATGHFDHNDPAQLHQLHVNVERIRVPEVLFSPSIAGVDQAGLIEISSGILQRSGHQEELIKDIFVTGGFASLEGLDTRIERELRAVLPTGSDLRVRKAQDVKLDAWRGAAKWINGMSRGERGKVLLTKKAWEECGGEYLIDHDMGNVIY